MYRPTNRDLTEPLIEGFALPLHTTHERERELVEFTTVRVPTLQDLVYRTLGDVALVKH
jgi:hypothetical protein